MDVEFLAPLYDAPGPWLSAYLDVSRDTEDAGHAIALRWRGIREELADQRSDGPGTRQLRNDPRLAELDDVLARNVGRHDRHGAAVFVAADGPVRLMSLPYPPPRDLGHIGPLPHVLPLLQALGEPVPWVRVVTDRHGADVASSGGWDVPQEIEVEGSAAWPLHKVASEGWTQPRRERAVETAWDRNAAEVAKAVVAEAEEVDAEVLVVGGDVRARRLMLEHLPDRWARRAIQTEGTVDDVLGGAVAAAAIERREEVLGSFRAAWPAGLARTGVAGVVAAARAGALDTLLLDASGVAEPVWVDPHSGDLACSLDELVTGDAVPERADNALVRVAAESRAAVVLVGDGVRLPIELPEEVGAILRYPA